MLNSVRHRPSSDVPFTTFYRLITHTHADTTKANGHFWPSEFRHYRLLPSSWTVVEIHSFRLGWLTLTSLLSSVSIFNWPMTGETFQPTSGPISMAFLSIFGEMAFSRHPRSSCDWHLSGCECKKTSIRARKRAMVSPFLQPDWTNAPRRKALHSLTWWWIEFFLLMRLNNSNICYQVRLMLHVCLTGRRPWESGYFHAAGYHCLALSVPTVQPSGSLPKELNGRKTGWS